MNGQIPWTVIALCLNHEVVFCPLGSLAKMNNAFMKIREVVLLCPNTNAHTKQAGIWKGSDRNCGAELFKQLMTQILSGKLKRTQFQHCQITCGSFITRRSEKMLHKPISPVQLQQTLLVVSDLGERNMSGKNTHACAWVGGHVSADVLEAILRSIIIAVNQTESPHFAAYVTPPPYRLHPPATCSVTSFYLKRKSKENPASLAPKWTFLGLMTRFGNHLENCFKGIASLHAALWRWIKAFQPLAERKLRSCREPFFVFFLGAFSWAGKRGHQVGQWEVSLDHLGIFNHSCAKVSLWHFHQLSKIITTSNNSS